MKANFFQVLWLLPLIHLSSASPNNVPFEDCTSSATLSDPRYDPLGRIDITTVYAQIADLGDGFGTQLKLTALGQTQKQLNGFSNVTSLSSE